MVMVSFGPMRCGTSDGGASGLLGRGLYDLGRKFSATTALGITDTISGSRDARKTVFSLL